MFKRILVPVDGSPTSDKALSAALHMAEASVGPARLRLVYVVEEIAYLSGYDVYGGATAELITIMRQQGEAILKKAMATCAAAAVEADSMMLDKLGERLGETVATAAKLWNADLIVVGTHGRHGLGRVFLGSGAEQIIRLAPVPVLVVRSSEADPGNPVQ